MIPLRRMTQEKLDAARCEIGARKLHLRRGNPTLERITHELRDLNRQIDEINAEDTLRQKGYRELVG